MISSKTTDYQIKTSRSGQPVPVVDEIHLHSIYDPKKEATGLIENNKELFSTNNKILILGLGFAYHIKEALRQLKIFHKDYEIRVIEPNHKIYEDCMHYNPLESEFSKIHVSANIEELYSDLSLVNFLSDRPGVLAHPASFNLNDNFFRTFLTYKANQSLGTISNHIQNQELLEMTSTMNQKLTLDQNIKDYLCDKNKISNKLDHLLIAYKELALNTQTSK